MVVENVLAVVGGGAVGGVDALDFNGCVVILRGCDNACGGVALVYVGGNDGAKDGVLGLRDCLFIIGSKHFL